MTLGKYGIYNELINGKDLEFLMSDIIADRDLDLALIKRLIVTRMIPGKLMKEFLVFLPKWVEDVNIKNYFLLIICISELVDISEYLEDPCALYNYVIKYIDEHIRIEAIEYESLKLDLIKYALQVLTFAKQDATIRGRLVQVCIKCFYLKRVKRQIHILAGMLLHNWAAEATDLASHNDKPDFDTEMFIISKLRGQAITQTLREAEIQRAYQYSSINNETYLRTTAIEVIEILSRRMYIPGIEKYLAENWQDENGAISQKYKNCLLNSIKFMKEDQLDPIIKQSMKMNTKTCLIWIELLMPHIKVDYFTVEYFEKLYESLFTNKYPVIIGIFVESIVVCKKMENFIFAPFLLKVFSLKINTIRKMFLDRIYKVYSLPELEALFESTIKSPEYLESEDYYYTRLNLLIRARDTKLKDEENSDNINFLKKCMFHKDFIIRFDAFSIVAEKRSHKMQEWELEYVLQFIKVNLRNMPPETRQIFLAQYKKLIGRCKSALTKQDQEHFIREHLESIYAFLVECLYPKGPYYKMISVTNMIYYMLKDDILPQKVEHVYRKLFLMLFNSYAEVKDTAFECLSILYPKVQHLDIHYKELESITVHMNSYNLSQMEVGCALFKYQMLTTSNEQEIQVLITELLHQLENYTIEEIAKDFPFQGRLKAISTCISTFNLQVNADDIISPVHKILKLVRPMLIRERTIEYDYQVDTEAFENEDLNDCTDLRVTFCWRSLKEGISLLKTVLLQLITKAKESVPGLVESSMELMLDLLISLDHCGAYHSIYVALKDICKSLLLNGSKTYLMHLIDQTLNGIKEERFIIKARRSGGLSLAFLAFSMAEDRQKTSNECLSYIMKQLLSIINSTSCTDYQMIHSMNSLKFLLAESSFRSELLAYTSDLIEIAFEKGFNSKNFCVRNCSVMLFSTLMFVLFGSKKANMAEDSKKDVTVNELFNKFNGLCIYFIKKLAAIDQEKSQNCFSLYAILLLLSRLKVVNNSFPDELELRNFKDKMIHQLFQFCGSPVLNVRKCVSLSLLPFLYDINHFVESYLQENINCTTNELHGHVLIIKNLLHQSQITLATKQHLIEYLNTVKNKTTCPFLKSECEMNDKSEKVFGTVFETASITPSITPSKTPSISSCETSSQSLIHIRQLIQSSIHQHGTKIFQMQEIYDAMFTMLDLVVDEDVAIRTATSDIIYSIYKLDATNLLPPFDYSYAVQVLINDLLFKFADPKTTMDRLSSWIKNDATLETNINSFTCDSVFTSDPFNMYKDSHDILYNIIMAIKL